MAEASANGARPRQIVRWGHGEAENIKTDREEDANKLGDAARGERDNVGLKRTVLHPPRIPQPHRSYDVTLSRPGPQLEILPDSTSDLCLDTH